MKHEIKTQLRPRRRNNAPQIAPRLMQFENGKIRLKQPYLSTRVQAGIGRLTLSVCCACDACNQGEEQFYDSR
jgi:hypothetical protein